METTPWDKALRENLAANPPSPYNPQPGSPFFLFTGNPNPAVTPVRPPPPSAPLGLNRSNIECGESTFVHPMNPMPPPAPVTTPNIFAGRQAGQPAVDFNDAIYYVNKIKSRFNSQPDKYKQFLEILYAYKEEQRNTKDGTSSNHLTEHEVYNQVAKLFENQEDLLQEFGQFLPDATPPPPPVSSVSTARQNHNLVKDAKLRFVEMKKPKARQEYNTVAPVQQPPPKPVTSAPKPKRSLISGKAAASTKKAKCISIFKDISLAEAGKYGTLDDFAFLDKVRHFLRSQDEYDNFLRVLLLFNDEIISRSEALQLATPFLSRAPELLARFKDLLGHNDQASSQQYEPVQSSSRQEKVTEEQVLEIDFSTCKRLETSYYALPKNYTPPKCSGRTSLCREVLNDVWVSFPTSSEDSTFATSKKSQFEEYTYRCEDERFELDIIIETNTETIRCLEVVLKKMSRMSPKELQEFQLDDCLGGTSQTIHQQAIRRLYGEKTSDIIEGLKTWPQITVPLVLKRLKAKEEEWMEAQKEFNKVWSEQAEHFYLKSLDPQPINFIQGDIRDLRSNTLLNGSDTINDEGQEQNIVETPTNSQPYEGPHPNLQHRDRFVLNDACNLLLRHMRRQTSIPKGDKRKMKQMLKNLVPDLFRDPNWEMSDDENDERLTLDRKKSLCLNGNQDLRQLKGGERNSRPGRRSNGSKSKKGDETEINETGGPSGASKGQEESGRTSRRGSKMSLAEGRKGKGKI